MASFEEYPKRFGGKFKYKTFGGIEENVATYKEVVFMNYPLDPYTLKCDEARVDIVTGLIQFYNDGKAIENVYTSA